MCSLKLGPAGAGFAAPENENSPDNAENGQNAAEGDDLENGGAVGRTRRVVVITEEQDVVDGGTNFTRRGIHQPQAHVPAGILDAIKVAGDAAVWRQDQHAAGVSE